ncbi:MAG: GNAT family N-acetyltransferase [Treponema sp.]|nr:GNAT family N-acetyltransferase [Treponema sp.]
MYINKEKLKTQPTIIAYNESYRQAVFDFTEACFTELGKAFEPSGRHSYYTDIANNFERFYCMLYENKVIGTVALRKIDSITMELKALYLVKDFRGRGLGHKLLKTAITEARNLGYKNLILDSMSKYKDAIRLYEKFGFKYTDCFKENTYADIFMQLQL